MSEGAVGAKLLDGKVQAAQLGAELAQEAQSLRGKYGFLPGLAVVLVGEDPAAKAYSRRITATFNNAGVPCETITLPAGTGEGELRDALIRLNGDSNIAGVIVQMPLPPPLTARAVTEVLAPAKDVDGLCPVNAGLLFMGQESFVPSTPLGGLELLKRYGITLRGRRAVVVGRSLIVGRPMAMLLLHEHVTVTICHTRTVDLPAVVREGDLLIAAIGRAKFIQGDWVRPGAVVVDFGTNYTPEGLVGDVDFQAASQVAEWITPVPGGTGPMTNVMLLRNTLQAARRALEGRGEGKS